MVKKQQVVKRKTTFDVIAQRYASGRIRANERYKEAQAKPEVEKLTVSADKHIKALVWIGKRLNKIQAKNELRDTGNLLVTLLTDWQRWVK